MSGIPQPAKLLETAEGLASALRAATNAPPMVDGRVVDQPQATTIAADLRTELVLLLDNLSERWPNAASDFASRWHWCEPQLSIPLTRRYPLRPGNSKRLQWPAPPAVNAADVDRLIVRQFQDTSKATAILAEYCGPEPDRVRVAVIRHAQNDLGMLERAVRGAIDEYRSVLITAEYPSYNNPSFANLTDSEKQRRIDEDHAHFVEWFSRRGEDCPGALR